jgi:hypothetical protein
LPNLICGKKIVRIELIRTPLKQLKANSREFPTPHIYIELDYGPLQNTRALCVLRYIINFKSEMIDYF